MPELLAKVTLVWRYLGVFCQMYNSFSLIKTSVDTANRITRLESAFNDLSTPVPCDDDETKSWHSA